MMASFCMALMTSSRLVLFCVAAGLWVLYFHEILFRSGRVQTHWVKRRLADLGLMLLIALVTILLTSLISGFAFSSYALMNLVWRSGGQHFPQVLS